MAEKKRAKTDKAGKTVTFTIPQVPRPTFSMQSALWRRKWALGVIFLLLAFLSGYGGAIVANNSRDDGLISTTVGNEKKVITSQSQLISKIAQEVGPSVVSITATIASDQPLNETDPFGFGMPAPESRRSQAAGTGIIISGKGIIVTNRHVVPKGTSRVSVTLSDGTELKNVTVIGRTNDNDSLDIAFLKIHDTKGKKLVPASIGNSASVQVGDDVIAIGNALGQFQNTVTSGIISGYGRSVLAQDDSGGTGADNLDNLFQTDAAINEGNSGGPLVNLSGQVIGINTAVAGNAQNIGFAIPINDVRGLIDQVLKTGKFERPYLGVRYVPLNQEIAAEFGLRVDRGAFIVPSNDPGSPSVIADGPAARAGLEEQDVITHVDGKKIDQGHSLSSMLAPHKPGDRVKLTVLRGDKTFDIQVTLGALPDSQ